jgi:hypothetical protein
MLPAQLSCYFVVTLTYQVDLSEVDAALPEHVAWLDQQYADGVFVASGPQVPTPEALERRLALDPFGRLSTQSLSCSLSGRLTVSSSCSDRAPTRHHASRSISDHMSPWPLVQRTDPVTKNVPTTAE